MENSVVLKTAKAKQTRKGIIDAYLGLLRTKKWDRITVRELCSVADITRGTFYQYFDDIYSLMEQLENEMLDNLKKRYDSLPGSTSPAFPPEKFVEKFNYSPPGELRQWFEFCYENRTVMAALLDARYGDVYFVHKIHDVLREHINHVMDEDHMPHDGLRSYFVNLLVEMHISICRSWLEPNGQEEPLSVDGILNLVNAVRVGTGYLSFKSRTAPEEFKKYMGEQMDGEKGFPVS